MAEPKVFKFQREGERPTTERALEVEVQGWRNRFQLAQGALRRIRGWSWLNGASFALLVASPTFTWWPWWGRMIAASALLGVVFVCAAFASSAVREGGLGDG